MSYDKFELTPLTKDNSFFINLTEEKLTRKASSIFKDDIGHMHFCLVGSAGVLQDAPPSAKPVKLSALSLDEKKILLQYIEKTNKSIPKIGTKWCFLREEGSDILHAYGANLESKESSPKQSQENLEGLQACLKADIETPKPSPSTFWKKWRNPLLWGTLGGVALILMLGLVLLISLYIKDLSDTNRDLSDEINRLLAALSFMPVQQDPPGNPEEHQKAVWAFYKQTFPTVYIWTQDDWLNQAKSEKLARQQQKLNPQR